MLDEKTLNTALEELSAIPYFPQAPSARGAIGAHIAKFCREPVKLRWLVDSAIIAMREWKGIGELRGLYCTRYKPADGKEECCSLPGYSPDEAEVMEAKEIYTSAYRELTDGDPFMADLQKLAKMKRLK